MIDLKAARNEAERYRAALARRGSAESFDELLEADERKRAVQTRVEELRARTKLKGKPTPEQLEEVRTAKEELQRLEQELEPLEARVRDLLDRIPNPPADDIPDGGEDDFAVVRESGTPPSFPFEARDHLALAAPFGWIDLERGAKVSGSRFAYRIGDLALVELALYRWALARVGAKGFVPVLPPVLVREEAMYGTGFFPSDKADYYEIPRDGLYLPGTSEVALAGLHAGEVLDDGALPLRYAGFSTNFRREAGAAGKDTRGMFRVHQFDKVEMFLYCRPEDSADRHEEVLAIEEELVRELGLPYRVVSAAARDLGASAVKRYDVEAWFPGQGRYREITSTSNTTDYQARRLDVRSRRDGRLEHVHTVNGTAATARAMLAVMENFQREDGTFEVPSCLTEFGAPPAAGAAARP